MAEKKFIDADWLTSKIFPFGMVADGNYPINAKSIKMAIDNALSADVVEVVRCCDCKHSTINGGDCNSIIVHYVRNEITQLNEAAYSRLDYCSYGERKEQT